MFFCEQAKETIFSANHPAQAVWEELQMQEKAYTYPNQPVLFDDLERYFVDLGADSPYMYFHKSPGLLRVKAQSGLGKPGVGSHSVKSRSSTTVI